MLSIAHLNSMKLSDSTIGLVVASTPREVNKSEAWLLSASALTGTHTDFSRLSEGKGFLEKESQNFLKT